MTFSACIIATVAFLSGGAAAVFVMLVIGIRRADRARSLFDAPGSGAEAFTRSVLGGGTYREWPSGNIDRRED